MFGQPDPYSQTVTLMKIGLPLLALGLLSTLFLLARNIDTEASIPYATVDVKKVADEQRLSKPEFSTVWSDGTSLIVTADRALPDARQPGIISADPVDGIADTPDGVRINFSSDAGLFNSEAGFVDLTGNVVATTDTGFKYTGEELTALTRDRQMVSDLPVTMTSDIGRLDAGNMVITRRDDETQSYHMVFKGGVKLLYKSVN